MAANIKVAKYPRVSVLSNGALIEMELASASDQSVTLQFDPEALQRFLGRTVQAIADARNQKHAMTGNPGVPVLATVGTAAGPAVGGSHVVIQLKTNSGTDFHFGMPTEAAAQFAKHVAEAVEGARRQAAQTRQ
jgi:hypothetical protein